MNYNQGSFSFTRLLRAINEILSMLNIHLLERTSKIELGENRIIKIEQKLSDLQLF